MPIQIPRSQISANLGQRHRPVDTSVADQVQMEGFANLAGIGKTLFDSFADAARKDSVRNVEAQMKEKMVQAEKEIDGLSTLAKKMQFADKFAAGWAGEWDKAVGSAKKGLLPGSGGMFQRDMDREADIAAIDVNDFVRRKSAEAINKEALQKIAIAQKEGNWKEMQRIAVDTKEYLTGEQFKSVIGASDVVNRKQKDEAVYNDIYELFTGDDWTDTETGKKTSGPDKAQQRVDQLVSDGIIDREEGQRILRQVGADAEHKARGDAAQVKALVEAKQETDRQGLVDQFVVTGNYTNYIEAVNNTDLDATEKLSWITRLDARAKALVEEKEDPFEMSNPEVYNPLFQKVALDANSVTNKELVDLLGKGLSISNYEKLKKMKEDGVESPVTRASVTRGHRSISGMAEEKRQFNRKAGTYTPQMARDIDDEELRDQDELDAWIVSHPDATDEDITKKVKALNRAKEDEVVLSVYERTILFGGAQDRFLKTQRINRLKAIGVWQGLNEQEKASATRLINVGITVEEIMKRLEP